MTRLLAQLTAGQAVLDTLADNPRALSPAEHDAIAAAGEVAELLQNTFSGGIAAVSEWLALSQHGVLPTTDPRFVQKSAELMSALSSLVEELAHLERWARMTQREEPEHVPDI